MVSMWLTYKWGQKMVGCPLLVTLTRSVLSCLVLLSIFVSWSVKSLALVSFTILFSFFIFIIFWQKGVSSQPWIEPVTVAAVLSTQCVCSVGRGSYMRQNHDHMTHNPGLSQPTYDSRTSSSKAYESQTFARKGPCPPTYIGRLENRRSSQNLSPADYSCRRLRGAQRWPKWAILRDHEEEGRIEPGSPGS